MAELHINKLEQHSHKNTGNRWLNPLNKLAFQKAVKQRKSSVKISHTEEYTLDYGQRPGVVCIRNANGFSPIGYFEIDRVLDPLWLSE